MFQFIEDRIFNVLQDAIDLFLGNYVVNSGQKISPFHDQRDWKYLAVSALFLY